MSEATTDAYANALFEIARAEGNLASVENELYAMAKAVETNDALRATLTDQAIPVERRQGVVEDLLGNKANPITTALVSFVVGIGRAKDLPQIINELVERAAAERQQAVAEVRVAQPLDENQQARLVQALELVTGKKLSLKVSIDPSILGGIVTQIDDTIIDGSVRHRLEQLKVAL